MGARITFIKGHVRALLIAAAAGIARARFEAPSFFTPRERELFDSVRDGDGADAMRGIPLDDLRELAARSYSRACTRVADAIRCQLPVDARLALHEARLDAGTIMVALGGYGPGAARAGDGFECPWCGSTCWGSRQLADGSLFRHCHGPDCRYCWHQIEDLNHAIFPPDSRGAVATGRVG